MVPKIQEMKGVIQSDNGWTLLVEAPADDIKIETKKSIRELTMMRAKGYIEWPAKDIMRCMQNNSLRKQWSFNTDIFRHESKVGVNGFISYMKTIKVFGIEARDFKLNYLMNEEPDGTILWCAQSSENENEMMISQIGEMVRGHAALIGCVIKPVSPSKCLVTMVQEVDLKGAIPAYAQRAMFKDHGYQIYKLREVLKQWKTLFPGDKM